MCLNIKKIDYDNGELVAQEEIVVYKFIVQLYDIDGQLTLYTPYQCAIVKIGESYESDLNVVRYRSNILDEPEYAVEAGLHSYMTLEDTIDASCNFSERVIVKCIIPIGARYYKGTTGIVERKSYASDKLKYVEIVKTC